LDMAKEGFSLPPESVLLRNQALRTLRKEGTVVLLDPETGCWASADERDLELLAALMRPVTWRQVTEGKRPSEAKALSTRVERLYMRKMLEINGRSLVTSQGAAPNLSIVLAVSGDPAHLPPGSIPSWKSFVSGAMESSPCRRFLVYMKGLRSFHRDDDMASLVTYVSGEAKRRCREVIFAIETEEVVADTETLDFVSECRAELHWMAGRASSAELEPQMERLMAIGSRGLTVFPHIAWYGKECVQALEMLLRSGIRTMALDLPFTSGAFTPADGDLKPDSLSKDLFDVLEMLCDTAKELRSPFVLHDLSLRVAQMQSRSALAHPCLCSPCDAGKSVITCDERGLISFCGVNAGNRNDSMCIGSIDDIPDLAGYLQSSESLRRLRERSVDSVPRCRRCMWKRYCCGGCVLRVIGSGGDLMREDPWCRFFQLFYESLLWKLVADPLFGVYLGGSRL